jgi:hypothetical protein
LIIGHRVVLGVDCCHSASGPTSEGLSVVADLLRDLRKPVLYWTLTHFHYDHFQGFGYLLDQLGGQITKVLVPNSYTSGDIADEVAIEAAAESSDATSFIRAKNEFVSVKRALLARSLNGKVITVSGSHTLFDWNLTPESGRSARIRSFVWGPDYRLGTRLRGRAAKQRLAGGTSRSAGNHSSYLVHLSCGRFQALLLGDAPCSRSQEFKTKIPTSSSFLLKVAHHGAEDGTSAELLAGLNRKAPNTFALLCPFKNQGLPRKETLELLEASGYQMIITEPAGRSSTLEQDLLRMPGSPIDGRQIRAWSPGTATKRLTFGDWGASVLRSE